MFNTPESMPLMVGMTVGRPVLNKPDISSFFAVPPVAVLWKPEIPPSVTPPLALLKKPEVLAPVLPKPELVALETAVSPNPLSRMPEFQKPVLKLPEFPTPVVAWHAFAMPRRRCRPDHRPHRHRSATRRHTDPTSI